MSLHSDISNTVETSSEVKSMTTRDTIFPITAHNIKTTTDRKMTVFTSGDVYTNYVNNTLQMSLDGFEALEDFLLECEANESVHGINPENSAKMFDIIEKCQDAYNRCIEHMNNLI